MVDIISKEVSGNDMKGMVGKLIPDSISKDIEKACHGIYPLHDVYIRKVNIIIIMIFLVVFFVNQNQLLLFIGEGS